MDFNNRENEDMILSIGKYLFKIIQIVPQGVIIFFPSYYLLNKYFYAWMRGGVIDTIKRVKKVFFEEKDPKKFKVLFEKFSRMASSGAIFFGVARGKLSEGMNLSDEMARCVVMVGLPFANNSDPKIKSKKEFLDNLSYEMKHKTDSEGQKISNLQPMGGKKWYVLDAINCVSQCIGRAIRHRNDYGSIILMD